MKKQMKQVAAATLAALCLGAVTIPTIASAATITVTTPEAPSTGNIVIDSNDTFVAYKVFAISSVGNDLIKIDGSSVSLAVAKAFNSLIASDDADITIGFVEGSETDEEIKDTADTVAQKIENYLNSIKNDNTAMQNLARALAPAVATNTKYDLDVADGVASVDVGNDFGYYLVTGVTKDGDEIINSSVMLKSATDDITINLKADKPTITKKIVEGDKRVDTNTAGVGDTVTYELTSQVPNTSRYSEYTFVMKDTLSSGLTYTADSVTVTVGGDTVTNGYNVYTNVVNGETLINIVFTEMKDWGTATDDDEEAEPQVGDAIKVQFKATVNENAVIWNDGGEGNPNDVYLSYSNNPNVEVDWNDKDGDGTPDEDDNDDDHPDAPPADDAYPDNPTEDTPEDQVITYVTKIGVYKYDTSNDNAMSGVAFTLTGTTEDGKSVTMNAVTDENGELTFSGLDAGTYVISEDEAPVGYIKAENVNVTIGSVYGNDAHDTFTEFTYNETDDNIFRIGNKPGTELPSTGGIGTTIFTIVGLTLMATAAGAFIIKRKVTAQ